MAFFVVFFSPSKGVVGTCRLFVVVVPYTNNSEQSVNSVINFSSETAGHLLI